MKKLQLIIVFIVVNSTLFATDFVAKINETAPVVDGLGTDACWQDAQWYPMDQVWIPYGANVPESDFSGKFKLTWTPEKLYLLAEIVDDSLSDDHADRLSNYWEDDCLEIFIDEDASGGDHTYNFNAFAYHISTIYDIIDLNTSQSPEAFNDHADVVLTKEGNTYTWELALNVYNDTYTSGGNNTPVTLTNGKTLGFSLAYCDNDETTGRENFFGSTQVPEANYNDHWQNASWFGNLTLTDGTTDIINSDNSFVNVYPNPAMQGSTVYFDLQPGVSTMKCFTLRGKLIYETTKNYINTHEIPQGVYIISVERHGETFSQKLIVN